MLRKKILPELRMWSVALALSIAITAVHHFCTQAGSIEQAGEIAMKGKQLSAAAHKLSQ